MWMTIQQLCSSVLAIVLVCLLNRHGMGEHQNQDQGTAAASNGMIEWYMYLGKLPFHETEILGQDLKS